jgi:hypothetical protein
MSKHGDKRIVGDETNAYRILHDIVDKDDIKAAAAAAEAAEAVLKEKLNKDYTRIDKKIIQYDNFNEIIKNIDVFGISNKNLEIENLGKINRIEKKTRENYDYDKRIQVQDTSTYAIFMTENKKENEIIIHDTFIDIDPPIYILKIDLQKLNENIENENLKKNPIKIESKNNKNSFFSKFFYYNNKANEIPENNNKKQVTGTTSGGKLKRSRKNKKSKNTRRKSIRRRRRH